MDFSKYKYNYKERIEGKQKLQYIKCLHRLQKQLKECNMYLEK